ncbi:MAG: hypothetical protein EHM58_07105 [Ignavibacteriae bacterium]|nr:MAG: hypothetical protein EHM58_07105 [Ignavibacteriota bacterium]
MKKTLLLLIILFIFTPDIQSQKLKNEMAFSYGFGSIQEIGTDLGIGLLIYAFDIFTDSSDISGASGPIILKYNKFVSSNISFGLTASYTGMSITNYSSSTEPRTETHYSVKFYTLMGNANFIYSPKNIIQLYSGISLGMTFANAKATSTVTKEPYNNSGSTLAVQVNALGIRVGNKIGGFLELGLGYNGIVNGGFSVKF